MSSIKGQDSAVKELRCVITFGNLPLVSAENSQACDFRSEGCEPVQAVPFFHCERQEGMNDLTGLTCEDRRRRKISRANHA